MILDRLYKPTHDELIYHYCGAEAFAQIIRTRTMWHTAFTALNDATERKWGFDQFRDAADKLRKVYGANFIDRISEIVRLSQDYSVAMISSYSLIGDLLSQWRAYADDGRGFSIGFSPQELEMPVKPLRVLYDRAAQRKELTNNINHVFEVEKKQFGFKYDERFREHWFQFGLDLCAPTNILPSQKRWRFAEFTQPAWRLERVKDGLSLSERLTATEPRCAQVPCQSIIEYAMACRFPTSH